MSTLKLISWNINGARAAHKKGFLNWLDESSPDIVCLQEIRAMPEQLAPELAAPLGYHCTWNPSTVKKGYSGTAILSKQAPLSVELGLGEEQFDGEGRTTVYEYEEFVLVNSYFPNGRRDHSRVPFKMQFCELFLEYCERWRAKGKEIVFCGDLNTSHCEIDLARPKDNRRTTGFLEEERAWIDRVIEAGYIDSFRHAHPGVEGAYTWWSVPMRARDRNIGWRLDYFFVSEGLHPRVKGTSILADVMGSDHCPVELTLSL